MVADADDVVAVGLMAETTEQLAAPGSTNLPLASGEPRGPSCHGPEGGAAIHEVRSEVVIVKRWKKSAGASVASGGVDEAAAQEGERAKSAVAAGERRDGAPSRSAVSSEAAAVPTMTCAECGRVKSSKRFWHGWNEDGSARFLPFCVNCRQRRRKAMKPRRRRRRNRPMMPSR